jgi:hypothetical protein
MIRSAMWSQTSTRHRPHVWPRRAGPARQVEAIPSALARRVGRQASSATNEISLTAVKSIAGGSGPLAHLSLISWVRVMPSVCRRRVGGHSEVRSGEGACLTAGGDGDRSESWRGRRACACACPLYHRRWTRICRLARAGGGPQFWLIVGVAGAWPGRNHAAAYHILRRCARTVSLSHT